MRALPTRCQTSSGVGCGICSCIKSFSVVLSYLKSVVQDATDLCLLQAPQPGSELSLSRQRLRQLGLLPANALLCLLTFGLRALQCSHFKGS